jgi:uncharacterized membrane protein YeaQ/YmgE (transglycosylase-associated protein family)
MDTHEGQVILHIVRALQIGVVALACGWFAERLLSSESRGWFAPVFSGIAGIYLGPPLARLVNWHSGPVVGDRLILPIFAGALVACVFVKLLTLGLASARR